MTTTSKGLGGKEKGRGKRKDPAKFAEVQGRGVPYIGPHSPPPKPPATTSKRLGGVKKLGSLGILEGHHLTILLLMNFYFLLLFGMFFLSKNYISNLINFLLFLGLLFL